MGPFRANEQLQCILFPSRLLYIFLQGKYTQRHNVLERLKLSPVKVVDCSLIELQIIFLQNYFEILKL